MGPHRRRMQPSYPSVPVDIRTTLHSVPGYEITEIVDLVDAEIGEKEVGRLLAVNGVGRNEELIGILGIIPAPAPTAAPDGFRTIGTLVLLEELEKETKTESIAAPKMHEYNPPSHELSEILEPRLPDPPDFEPLDLADFKLLGTDPEE